MAGIVLHRIGGGTVENLRLKPRETTLNPPGISVLMADDPGSAADQIRSAFPAATNLRELANTIGSIDETAIRAAGFDIVADPTRAFPNHYRIIHPQGAAGFSIESLAQLAAGFANTTGHSP